MREIPVSSPPTSKPHPRHLIAGVVISIAVAGLLALGGCSPGVSVSYPAESAKAAKTNIGDTQADTRDIGNQLRDAADGITGEAQQARTKAREAPPAVSDSIAGSMDKVIDGAAKTKALANNVDPGITRKLEQLAGQVTTLEGELQAAITRAVKAERERDEAQDYSRWVPWLLLGLILGGVMIAIKAWPPAAHFPGEVGAGVVGGCLLGLLYIHTAGRYPLAVAVGGGVLVVALIAPTIWRLNKMQAKQAAGVV